MSYAKNSNGPSASTTFFSPDYVSARAQFREKVKAAGGRLEPLELGAKGPNGESLTIDIAWFGPEKPRRVFVHSSGLHGVEAFAGSAIQLQWLKQGIPPIPEGTAIVLVHVVNPYGMAWLRRFNENNVDLSRNFLAPDEKFAGAPETYRKLNGFLNPTTPPSRDLFYLRAAWPLVRYRMAELRQAIAGGQYANPKGLFFGGQRLEEGPTKLQGYMADHLAGVERIVAIDIHTGLGRFAEDCLLMDAAPERVDVNHRMRAVFGERVQLLDSYGVAYEVRGAIYNMYYRVSPTTQVYFAAQEFGTYNPARIVKALRAENRWHHYGAGTTDHPTKTELQEVFNPGDARWRRLVLQRGREVINQSVELAFEKSRSSGAS